MAYSSNYFILDNMLLGKRTLEFEITLVNCSFGYSVNGTIIYLVAQAKNMNHPNSLPSCLSLIPQSKKQIQQPIPLIPDFSTSPPLASRPMYHYFSPRPRR